MTTLGDKAGMFSCAMELPVMFDEVHRQYIPVVGVFRGGLAAEEVDQWVMHPNGTPRSDRELAAEVLMEIWNPARTHGRTRRHALNVADILKLDCAAAIVVSTFLAALPRVAGRYWTRSHLLRGDSRFPGKKIYTQHSRVPQQWREV